MRAPRGLYQRLADGTVAQRVGGALDFRNASPVPEQASAVAMALAGTAATSGTAWMDDLFTLTTDGAQDVTLTYLPVELSEDVKLNGIGAERATEWTRSGQVVSLQTALDARTDDLLTVHYQYLTGTPAYVAGAENDCGVLAIDYTATTHPEDMELLSNYRVDVTFELGVDPNSPLYDIRALLLFQDTTTGAGNLYNNWTQVSTLPNVWKTGDLSSVRYAGDIDLADPIVSFTVHVGTHTCSGLLGTRRSSLP